MLTIRKGAAYRFTMRLKRAQLYEIGEQSWFPELLREAYQDCLSLLHRIAQPYHAAIPTLIKLANVIGVDEVLDLGSGSGAHLETVLSQEHGRVLPRFVASDLYPNVASYEYLVEKFGDRVGYLSRPLDILKIDDVPFRAFLICTTFHHLPPPEARTLLQSVLRKNSGILILELNSRRIDQILLSILALPLLTLAPFFARKKSLAKFVFGTFLPIVPVIVFLDGIISALRCYEGEEILDLVPDFASGTVVFESKEFRYGRIFRGNSTLIYPRALHPAGGFSQPAVTVEAAGSVSNDGIQFIVRAAAHAPTAANSQHWKFSWKNDELTVGNNPARSETLSSCAGVDESISLGAVLENVRIAATVFGREIDINVHHSPAPEPPSAGIRFRYTNCPPDPLAPYLFERVTNRRHYYRTKIPSSVIQLLSRSVLDFPELSLHWITHRDEIRRAAEMSYRAEAITWQHVSLNQPIRHWIAIGMKHAPHEGLPLSSLELPLMQHVFAPLLIHGKVVQALNVFGLNHLLACDIAARIRSSAALCLMSVRGVTPDDYVSGGKAMERFWICAASLGLSVHLVHNAILLNRHWRTSPAQFASRHSDGLQRIEHDLSSFLVDSPYKIPLVLFRIGYADQPSAVSGRLPLSEVLRIE